MVRSLNETKGVTSRICPKQKWWSLTSKFADRAREPERVLRVWKTQRNSDSEREREKERETEGNRETDKEREAWKEWIEKTKRFRNWEILNRKKRKSERETEKNSEDAWETYREWEWEWERERHRKIEFERNLKQKDRWDMKERKGRIKQRKSESKW